MRYSSTDVRPESKVTQARPITKAEKGDPLKAPGWLAREAAIRYINEHRSANDLMYQMGLRHGIARGFLYGMLCGALGTAVLAIAILGEWNESF